MINDDIFTKKDIWDKLNSCDLTESDIKYLK